LRPPREVELEEPTQLGQSLHALQAELVAELDLTISDFLCRFSIADVRYLGGGEEHVGHELFLLVSRV
jgi:hypothetical protein